MSTGCGRGGGLTSDAEIAALNAELAQMEGDLLGRLARLESNVVAVANAYGVAGKTLKRSEELMAGMPQGEVTGLVEQAESLARYREGVVANVEKVREAGEDERLARKNAEESLVQLRTLQGRYKDEVAPWLRGWRRDRARLAGQLSVWQDQRMEKEEDGAFATFFAFYEAASAQYREWGEWADQAEMLWTLALDTLLPEVNLEEAVLKAETEKVNEARSREEEGVAAIRRIPISSKFVTTAREEEIALLKGLQAELGKKLSPGWERPTRETADIRSMIEAKSKFVEEAKAEKIIANSEDLSKFVEDMRKKITNLPVWRPGIQHPDHPNVQSGETVGEWVPRPGYKARGEGDFDPVWTPGMKYPGNPHVFAAGSTDKWNKEPGWTWVHPASDDLSVQWTPGESRRDHPHVKSGWKQGAWEPNPGYKARWEGDLDPVWTPGMKYPGNPHVFAAENENEWNKEVGWEWVRPGTDDLSVKWAPGARDPYHPNIHASATEGQWKPDLGYKWASGARDDLSVVKMGGR